MASNPPGGAGPAPPRVEEPGEEARGRGPEPGEDKAEGEDDADPEAGIEVDIYEGASIKKRIGTLKDDANTLTHLLTHRYRKPFCESCVKAKMRHFRSKSGAFQREVKTFRDLITFDLVEASGDAENNDKYVMIIRDWHHHDLSNRSQEYRDGDQQHKAPCRQTEDQASLLGRRIGIHQRMFCIASGQETEQFACRTHEPVHRGPNHSLSSTCRTSNMLLDIRYYCAVPPDECRRD